MIRYDTNSEAFKNFIQLNKDKYEYAYIYGNAPSLNEIDNEFIDKNKHANTLTIGINRSYKKMKSDILIFTDNRMEEEINRDNPTNVTYLFKVTRSDNITDLQNWAMFHKFTDNFIDGLHVFRNTLVSTLHLCYLLNIRKIVLFGVAMDNREYFYGTHPAGYKPEAKYDESKLIGYDTHTIVKEVIEYQMKGFKIYHIGESKFLRDNRLSNGLRKENLTNI